MTAIVEQINSHVEGNVGVKDSPPITFESFSLPDSNQRTLGPPHAPDTVTPLALRPSSSPAKQSPTLSAIISTIQSQQSSTSTFTSLLARHGALLFRSLPIDSATTFSAFAHAFGFRPHEIIGIVVDRPLLASNVAPANESPPHVLIYNHNESPQVPHAPAYVFFYCHKAATMGGETPISSSLELFRRASEEIPGFVEALAEKGIRSRITYRVERQYAGGSTLRQAFGKEIEDGDDEGVRREKIERQIERYARGEFTRWEWSEDGSELTVEHLLPAIRTQPGTGLPVLFTGLAAAYKNSLVNTSARKAVVKQTFGDGTEIPGEWLRRLAEITDEIRVLHKWEEGDVLVFDNRIAQHGREPWQGEQADRVVMASLFDGELPGAYNAQPWAQVVQAADG